MKESEAYQIFGTSSWAFGAPFRKAGEAGGGAGRAAEGAALPRPFFCVQLLCLDFTLSFAGRSQQMSLMGCCFED